MIALITGGSGSGKSGWAEAFLASLGPKAPRVYLATLMVYDDEGRKRIARHRAMRADKGFETVERPLDIGGAPLVKGADVLLECLSTLVSNEMFAPGGVGMDCEEAVVNGVLALADKARNLVIVTNEIFSDGIAYARETMSYIQALGALNRALAERADLVIEVVYGIPIVHKGVMET